MTDNRVPVKYGSGVFLFRLMLLLTLGHSTWAMASYELPVEANIVEGTCDVEIATSTYGINQYQTDNKVDVNTHVNNSSFLKGGVMVGANAVSVRLKGCAGANSAGKTPKLMVASGSGVMSTAGDGYIFKPVSGGSADNRIGVVMIKYGSVPTGQEGKMISWNTSDYVKPGSSVEFGAQGTNVSAATTPLKFIFGLSCGSTPQECGSGAITSGKLQATVVLNFEYS